MSAVKSRAVRLRCSEVFGTFSFMSRSRYTSLVISCLAVALFLLLYPVYVIRPFRAQGPAELQMALFVLRYRILVELGCLLVLIAVVASAWKSGRLVTRTVGLVSVAIVAACAAFTQVNIYEILFHPVDQPRFGPAAQSKLGSEEKVIAVKVAGAARAYPVRNLAYHHLVNDTLGGVPIVPTY